MQEFVLPRGVSVTVTLPDGRTVVVTPTEIRAAKVTLAVEAPRDVKVLRNELAEAEEFRDGID